MNLFITSNCEYNCNKHLESLLRQTTSAVNTVSRAVIKQIVFKFWFTCGDYIDSLVYCHSSYVKQDYYYYYLFI